jgi:ankyrin repeat protein
MEQGRQRGFIYTQRKLIHEQKPYIPTVHTVIERKDRYHGRSSLHFAAVNGHVDVVRLLLKKGADVAAKDYGRSTALHHAATQGHGHVVTLLLGRMEDASIAATDEYYETTTLQCAAVNGHGDVVALLEKRMGIIGRKRG